MRKTRLLFLFFWINLVLLLNGCLDCEKASLSIDLTNKVAEVKYFNIVSDSRDEATIKKDFRGLIKMVYFDDDSSTDPDRVISKRLYRNNEQLDGMTRFSFRDLQKALKEFNIEMDQDGNYIVDVTKETENYHVGGNGQYFERDFKKLLRWNKNVKKIEFETKSKAFDETQKTGLLKHWLDWVEKNMKE